MSVKKDKYEISLWEDYIVAASGNIPEHYEESKIAIIGSDSMTSQFRAIEPKLVENINGTNVFTFKMFYTCIDNENGEKINNPFLNLLVNERKIKVLWKGKWYDLVIKSCQEDSSGKSITYTCKDLYINELSKNGFNLEFDTELENNQGTVQELAEKILDGSDWKLNYNSSDPTQIVKQKTEEAVYELTGAEIISNFTAYDENEQPITITATDKILVYYSVVQNQEAYFQFLYKEGNNFSKENSSQLVIDGECLYTDIDSWDLTTEPGYLLVKKDSATIIKISTLKSVSNEYRAERLVRAQKQILDPLTGNYVYLYSYDDGVNSPQDVYGNEETVYNDPTIVNNLLVNYKDFSSTLGWSGGELSHLLYPEFTAENALDYSAKSYLQFAAGSYLNSGIQQSSSFIPNGFQKGEEYIVRFKAMSNNSNKPSGTYINSGFTPCVCNYTFNETTYTLGTNYFDVDTATSGGNNWVEFKLTCRQSVTRSTLLAQDIGFFLVSDGIYWLEQVEFFPLIMGENAESEIIRINPGEMEKQSAARIQYQYYLANQAVTSEENLEYLYVGYEKWSTSSLTPVFNDNFEKIRSITAKNSNRFNLLQTLAETFECWTKFTIEHDDETGKILYDETGRAKKWVSFHTEIGQRSGIGFIYGIDLKTISRTINSDQITSKVIVTPNKNQYGKDGFCTIARSKENYSKENFILNFDYYVSQGLLDLGIINKDLYQTTPDAIGYYYWLNQYNTEYDTITEEVYKKKTELTKQESLLSVYSQYLTSTAEEIASTESDIKALASVSSMAAAQTYILTNPTNVKVITLMTQWTNLKNILVQYTVQRDNLNQSVTNLKTYLINKESRQEELIDLIEAKHQEFYNKYSRFIQEGSWTSEEYIDDNLYYLDAQSVLYTSSRPQISYNISVLRLSALEEFKNKILKLGDISFIQDTEFFGYTEINGTKTPYKEEVLVSEITSNFDSPENDSFQVQNYKTQFEDLFQRITATTQSLQYASGEYQRAANAFTDSGAINPLTLQNSFLLNQDLVISAQNESVTYDSTGLTVTDTSNPNKKVKVTSGGIFISIDGGITWKSAIRGEGISTQYLTAGAINTNIISIMDGNHTAFRWDADGINAYWNDSTVGTIINKFVRFDQYGIYGINNWDSGQTVTPYDPSVEDNGLKGEDKIWRDAQFGMTWKGFFIKNKYGTGYVEISSEKDIVVSDGIYDRLKIGNLGNTNNPIYGIRIRDGSNTIVMETIDNGTLWLKGQLNVLTTGVQTVGIGYLPAVKPETSIHEVINANNAFIVYEDGSILGSNVNFTGGTIGGLTIDQVKTASKSLAIGCIEGNSFKIAQDASITPSSGLHLQAKLTNLLANGSYEWARSIDASTWTSMSTDANYTFSYNSSYFDANGVCFIRLTYITSEGTYTAYYTLYVLTNGADGVVGTGIDSITPEYYLSTSKTIQQDGSWSSTPPIWETGKYVWTRNKIIYNNPTSTVYTTPICDSSWEAAQLAVPFISGTQTTTTASWKGVAPFAELVDGQQITYWLPQTSGSNVTLELTLSGGGTTGAIPCYYGGTTRLTTQYVSGSAIRMIYLVNAKIGAGTYTGWWADADYYSDTYDRVRYNRAILAKTAISAARLIVADTTNSYFHLAHSIPFQIDKPLLYAGTAIAAGTSGTNNYTVYPSSISIRSNSPNASLSFTAYQVVFIEGDLNGLIFTPTNTTNLYTTVPTDNGKTYMAIGQLYNTYQMSLYGQHDLYRFHNGVLKTITQIAIESVSSSEVEYYLSTSSSALLGGSWQTTAPAWVDGKYMWSRTKVTLNDGTISYTPSIDGTCIAGATGATGATGADGASYRIETNQNEIFRFARDEPGVETIALSPQELHVTIYPYTNGNSAEALAPSEVDFAISIMQNDGTWYALDPIDYASYLHFDDVSTSMFVVELQALIAEKYNTVATGEIEDSPEFDYVKELLEFSSNTIRVQMFQKNSTSVLYGQILIPLSWGTSKDMTKLSVYANEIYASIQSTALTFNANGLQIKNGGLEILNNENDTVFSADENGNLLIIGNIIATSGTFTGEVHANSGTLYDLAVNGRITVNDYLYIDGRATIEGTENPKIGIYSSNYDLAADTGFFLSETGGIYAADITLGKSATIADFIKMGNAWILNPLINNNHFLRIGDANTYNFLVKQDGSIYSSGGLTIAGISNYIGGSLKVGNELNYVLLDGTNQSISSSDYIDTNSTGWSLKSDGTAILNNAIIRGSIKGAVLEYDEIQAIGGIIIVRPSTIIKDVTIKDATTVTLTLENVTGFQENDYCTIQTGPSALEITWFTIHLVGFNNQVEIAYEDDINNLIGKPLVDFGKKGSIGIGINSSGADSLVTSNAISVFALDIIEESQIIDTKVILGKIPNESKYGMLANTYGLYAENVYLKGALISEYNEMSSGINTKSSIAETDNHFLQRGNILFWAGAVSLDAEDIQNAKFRVDSLGNVYAGSGYFSGTIITDAIITAAEIQTAVITGIAKDEETGEYKQAALTIKDADIGLSFVGNGQVRAELSNTVFSLNTIDFKVGTSFIVNKQSTLQTPFITIPNIVENTEQSITIQPTRIDFFDYLNEDFSICAVAYNNGLQLIEKDKEVMLLTKTMTTVQTPITFKDSLKMGEDVEIKQVKDENDRVIGYDLYINDES